VPQLLTVIEELKNKGENGVIQRFKSGDNIE
jgi:hypothetical protein